MKLNNVKVLLFVFTYANFLCALTQEEINRLALQVESKMVVSGPVGEITARSFLKGQGITDTNDINSIINLALKIKSDPKLKVLLSNMDSAPSFPDESLTLSTEEINKLALQLEPKMKGAGSEILVRNSLKQDGITNKKDQTSVINRIIEIQKNPKLKINIGSGQTQKLSKESLSNLTAEEIKDWALKAKSKMKGPMGEFIVRKFLKEQGVTSKADLDAIVSKIVELQKSVPQSESAVKPIKKLDVTIGGKSVATPVEVPAEVEEWAKKLRSFDPETQTFKIIKQLKEGNVEKDLWPSVMARIRQLRLEKQDEVVSGQEIKDVTPVEISTEVAPQKFDNLIQLKSIQQMIQFFESQTLEKFVNMYKYNYKFPVNGDGTLQLWIAVNIENKIHVIMNNKNSGLHIGQDWYEEFNDMDNLKKLTSSDIIQGIIFSLVEVTQNAKKVIYVYVQKSNGEKLAFAQLKNVETLPSKVIWSGSLIFNPKKIGSDKSFLVTDNPDLNIHKINIPKNFNGYNDDSFLQFIDFKIKNSLSILWQDLVLYFYFQGDNFERTMPKQKAYDWVLRHTEDAVYKG